jgi:hypothetical protein
MSLEEVGTFTSLKTPKTVFHYKNIITTPNFLTKIFVKLDQKDPIQVATAFFHAMYTYWPNTTATTINDSVPELLDEHQDEETAESAYEIEATSQKPTVSSNTMVEYGFLAKFIHVIQFCQQCAAKKMLPVLYTTATDQEALSRTDQHLINTFLKINYVMDHKIFKQNQVQEEKEPGFACLEPY